MAQRRQGPRGNFAVAEGQRDHHTNLILMCQEHHLLLDRRPEVYSVGVLRTIKAEHEKKLAHPDSQAFAGMLLSGSLSDEQTAAGD